MGKKKSRQQGRPPRARQSSNAAGSAVERAVEKPDAPESVRDPADVEQSVKDRPEFWDGVLRAVGTEPRTARDLGGASGVRNGINRARIVVVAYRVHDYHKIVLILLFRDFLCRFVRFVRLILVLRFGI